MVSKAMHSSRTLMEASEAVTPIRFSGCYKRELISAFAVRELSETSERFFIEIRQTDIVQKEFNVSAVIIDCNCKEVPINSIIKSRTHYY
jgi:hypothetical protein